MITHRKSLLIALTGLLLLSGITGGYGAAEKKRERISVREAVSVALLNNQDYKIAMQRLKAADEKVNAVWGQLMPVLESEASLARQKAESGAMSMIDGQYDIKILQLKFGINPGVFYNSLQLSRKAYTAAREETNRIKTDVEYNVIKSYFDLLLAGEVVKMRRDSLAVLKANLKDVENLYRTGSVPRFELLQAQVQLKSQEPPLFEAENNYRVAMDLFNFHLGSESGDYTADESVLTATDFKKPDDPLDSKMMRLTGIAMKNRPELLQLRLKRDMARHAENANSSYYLWPTFSVGGYYGKTKYMPNPVSPTISVPGPAPMTLNPDFSQISGTSEWQTTWYVRVAATYRWGSLIPADTVRAQEREERTRVREAEEEITRLKRLVGISIKSSYSKLITSSMTIKSQKENVARAEEGLRIARESYRAGVIKNSELLSAELSLTTAKTSYINAINGYFIALAELKREMGINDEKMIFGEVK